MVIRPSTATARTWPAPSEPSPRPAAQAPPDALEPFTVLVVCTGNICRSPAVERLIAARLGPASGVTISSAGTSALVGYPVSGPMAALIRAAGADATGFAARQLTTALVEESELVIAMTRQHRSAVVTMSPASVRRTFTLRELARLAPRDTAGGTPADRLGSLVTAAAARRSPHPVDARLDDVEDPYGRGDRAYERSFDELREAVETLFRQEGP